MPVFLLSLLLVRQLLIRIEDDRNRYLLVCRRVAQPYCVLFLSHSETLGAPLLRFLQEPALSLSKGRVRCCFYHEISAESKPALHAVSCPPFTKVREERGTRCGGSARDLKGWATCPHNQEEVGHDVYG
jgi:hypothetical protein